MLACIRSKQRAQALEVFIIAQASQRGMGRQVFFTQGLEQACSHLAREETRADSVDADAVLAPFPCQRAREVDHRRLGGVVGNGVHALGVASQTSNRGHVDDAAAALPDHAVLGHVLAQQEVAAYVQVHDLVPGVQRVVFGRCAPGGASVVDQDVDVAHALHRLAGQAVDFSLLGAVRRNPAGINARGLQFGGGRFQVRSLARTEHDFGSSLAQRMRHLQAQAARATGDEYSFSLEVEQLLDGTGHVVVS